ncbi:TlpA family protein disulfide reductase [Sphingobacterium lactis]|uniref:TlpA family protein disulfide reductase n=1 Tax=Sphingobacterium lactis TaxID=797291 RepID=UPI0037444357
MFFFVQKNGSYLYINIWAEWCMNCRVQVPYIHKLEEDMKGRNIKFIGISIDRDEEIGLTTKF